MRCKFGWTIKYKEGNIHLVAGDKQFTSDIKTGASVVQYIRWWCIWWDRKEVPENAILNETEWLTTQNTELQSRGTLQSNRTSQSGAVILWLDSYVDFCNVRNLIYCCIIWILLEYVTSFNISDPFIYCSLSILACNLALSKICHPLTNSWPKLDSPFSVFMYLLLDQNVFCEYVFSWL